MNKKGDILLQAIVFVVLFFIGGTISVFALPEFTGRFFICGIVFASLGVGVGNIVLNFGGR